jgi:hypothetical protein
MEGEKVMFIQFTLEELINNNIINRKSKEESEIEQNISEFLSTLFNNERMKNIKIYIIHNMLNDVSRVEAYIPLRLIKEKNDETIT